VALVLSRHDVPIRGLDPAHDGLKIAHLTDVHVGMITPKKRIRRAVELANESKPDLVFLTGDYVCYNRKHVARMGEQLRGLVAGTAVIATLGNHDYWTDGEGCARELRNNGYDVLINQHTELFVRGAPLTVVGIDDAITKHDDAEKAFAGVRTRTRLCLSHCPERADQAAERGANLVVSGHTHGGQVNVKGVTERIYRRITKRRYLSGWYDIGETALYVNRGVGQSSIPLRAGEGARCEVAIFTLRAA
jgi:predicted MPP superfamily phosphohydrolase